MDLHVFLHAFQALRKRLRHEIRSRFVSISLVVHVLFRFQHDFALIALPFFPRTSARKQKLRLFSTFRRKNPSVLSCDSDSSRIHKDRPEECFLPLLSRATNRCAGMQFVEARACLDVVKNHVHVRQTYDIDGMHFSSTKWKRERRSSILRYENQFHLPKR